MEKLNLSAEQEQDLLKSLLGRFKDYFKRFKGTIDKADLIEQSQSPQEKQVLADILQEREVYYNNLRDYHDSGLDIDTWYNRKLEETIEHQPSENREEEAHAFKTAVGNMADAEVEDSLRELRELNEDILNVQEETI